MIKLRVFNGKFCVIKFLMEYKKLKKKKSVKIKRDKKRIIGFNHPSARLCQKINCN